MPGTITLFGAIYFTGTSDGSNNILSMIKYSVTKRVSASINIYHDSTGALNSLFWSRSGASGSSGTNIYVNGESSFGAYGNIGVAFTPAVIIFHWVAQSEL